MSDKPKLGDAPDLGLPDKKADKSVDKADAAETKKADAAEAKQAKAIDKSDAAFKTYEKEQAKHEKTHPGEIDEPAYATYGKVYDKIPEDRPAGGMMGDKEPGKNEPVIDHNAPPMIDATTGEAVLATIPPNPNHTLKPKDWEPPGVHTRSEEVSEVTPDGKLFMVSVWFKDEEDAKKFQSQYTPHVKSPAPVAGTPVTTTTVEPATPAPVTPTVVE
jgi:hypothetical protein